MEALALPQRLLSPRAVVSTVSYGDDSAIYAIFSDDYVLNEYKTKDTGTAISDHKVLLEIKFPGNILTEHKVHFDIEEGKMGNKWTERFPKQWQAYMAQKTSAPEGMPLEIWSPLDKRRVMALKALNVHTVEQIAALSDATGPNIGMDWRKLRDMARATLKPNEGSAAISKLAAEKDALAATVEALKQQVAALSGKDLTSVAEESVPLKKRRVRRTKAELTQMEGQ